MSEHKEDPNSMHNTDYEGNERISRTIERVLNGDTRAVKKNTMPLQRAGQDRILRHYTLGGPNCDRDVRMYLELADLEHLVKIAKQSRSKRVILPRAGIKVVVRQSHGGHVYETFHIESLLPVAEVPPVSIQSPTTIQQVNQWQQHGILKTR